MTEYEALAAGDSKEHLKRAVVAGESDEDVSDGLGESDEGVSDGLAFDLSSFFSGRTKPPPPPPAPKQFDLMSLFALPPPKLPPPPPPAPKPLDLMSLFALPPPKLPPPPPPPPSFSLQALFGGSASDANSKVASSNADNIASPDRRALAFGIVGLSATGALVGIPALVRSSSDASSAGAENAVTIGGKRAAPRRRREAEVRAAAQAAAADAKAKAAAKEAAAKAAAEGGAYQAASGAV
jgi:hypothetical protein